VKRIALVSRRIRTELYGGFPTDQQQSAVDFEALSCRTKGDRIRHHIFSGDAAPQPSLCAEEGNASLRQVQPFTTSPFEQPCTLHACTPAWSTPPILDFNIPSLRRTIEVFTKFVLPLLRRYLVQPDYYDVCRKREPPDFRATEGKPRRRKSIA